MSGAVADPADTPWRGDSVGLTEQYRSGLRTPIAEVGAVLAAIGASALNAACNLAGDQALELARHVDLELPLAGVPFLVKEGERVEGWPWAEGAEVLADRIADGSSTLTSRLVAAGAIPIGQATGAEFSRATYTSTSLHGTTRNPWDLDRTPGGSSGGSAAAVAGGLVPLATATDGGGSIRLPAAYCGLPGLKVTMRLIPAGPCAVIEPLTVVAGVITRSVRDIARVLDVVSGPDGRDPFCAPSPRNFERGLAEPPRTNRTVAFLPSFGGAAPDEQCVEMCRAALEKMCSELSFEVVSIDNPIGSSDPLLSVMGALRILSFVGADVHPAEARMNPEVRESLALARSRTPMDVARVDSARTAVIETLGDLFDQVDLVVTPTTPGGPFSAEGPAPGPVNAALWPANVAGHPAITVPIGPGGDGLPRGVQIMGRHHEELELLRIAAHIERVRPWPLVAPARKV